MSLKRVKLFHTRSFIIFLFVISFLALISLLFEYYNFSKLKKFDDAEIEAVVLSQHIKTENSKTYSVLKLQAFHKFIYTTASKDIKNLRGRTLKLKIWTEKLTFLEYLKGFYVHSVILHVKPELNLKERVSRAISVQHDTNVTKELYGALFTASPMSKEVRQKLSALGIAHLFAISGFHLGVLSLILLALFNRPYYFFQQRYFPYRNRQRDLAILSAAVMLMYLFFLGFIPSLIRAFIMLIIGSVFYERHIKIISMQTLVVSILVILALFPTLFFTLGFWLSVCGVFYIFIFLKYFTSLPKIQMLISMSIWVYIMITPVSIYLFNTFSIYNPLSILLSILFLPIYIISFVLHVSGYGGMFDSYILRIFELVDVKNITISSTVLALHVSLSLLSVFYKKAFFLALFFALSTVIFAIYQIA